MYAIFNKYSNIKYLDVSHFNIDKVIDMSYMFNKRSNLTNLDVKF